MRWQRPAVVLPAEQLLIGDPLGTAVSDVLELFSDGGRGPSSEGVARFVRVSCVITSCRVAHVSPVPTVITLGRIVCQLWVRQNSAKTQPTALKLLVYNVGFIQITT